MAEQNSSRKKILLICILLCTACFVVYYAVSANLCAEDTTATCIEASPVARYFMTTFLAQVGNSGLLFSLMWYFGAPPLKKMLANRRDNMEREIAESARLKREAEAVAESSEKKMSQLGADVKRLTDSYRESADEECRLIAENAETAVNRLKEDAEASFELQSSVAKSAFERELMIEAIERARIDIANRLAGDPALRNKLIDQSIASLEL